MSLLALHPPTLAQNPLHPPWPPPYTSLSPEFQAFLVHSYSHLPAVIARKAITFERITRPYVYHGLPGPELAPLPLLPGS